MTNEYNLNADHVQIKSSKVISLIDHIVLTTEEKSYDLLIDVRADLEHIPEMYHEVMMNMLTAKYYNKVSFGDNPFSMCKPKNTRRWWQFGKYKK